MKRLFCIIYFMSILPFIQAGASADARSDRLLSQLSSKISALGSYKVAFTVTVEGNTVEGEYIVSGDKYYMTVGSTDVICDGKTRYEVNHTDEEIIVDKVNPDDKNILYNPTKAFEFAADNFAHRFGGESSEYGESCDIVLLNPVQKGTSILDITLAISKSNGLPAVLKYDAEGLSSAIEIVIDSFTSAPDVKASQFNFDRKKYKDYELIDFR